VVLTLDSTTTNSSCSLTGDTVKFLAAGNCVIDANQPGNGTFAAAPQVQQTITVGPAATVGPAVTKVTPNTGSKFTLVRIDGRNFIPAGTRCLWWDPSCGVTVHFGKHQAFVVYVSATSIWVFSPAGTGTVDVTVTVNNHTSPTSPADRFTYKHFHFLHFRHHRR
jgi:hypothetical protein